MRGIWISVGTMVALLPLPMGGALAGAPPALRQISAVVHQDTPADIEMWGQGDSFDDIFQLVTLRASSTLAPDGGNHYDAAKAHDGELSTAWVEGAKGDGIGEYLEVTLRRNAETEPDPTVQSMTLYNGYRKSRTLWQANNRIKRLRMSVNGKPYADFLLADAFSSQTVTWQKIPLPPPPKPLVLRFTIESVYPGTKHHDTALSEIEFGGSGIY